MTTNEDFQNLPPEKQTYISLSANVSRAYNAQQQLQKAALFLLAKPDEQSQKMAKELSITAQELNKTSSYLYSQQKEMEEHNPELKVERLAIKQQRQQERGLEPSF